jgi:hypothetical protein
VPPNSVETGLLKTMSLAPLESGSDLRCERFDQALDRSVVIVAGREVDSHFESGGCDQTLQGGKGWLFPTRLIGRNSLLAHLRTLGELTLRQPGLVSSEANQTCGQGWSWIVLTHGFQPTTYNKLFTTYQ